MKKLRQIKEFRVFVFTSFNALILFLIAMVGDITNPDLLVFTPFLIALMNRGTKYVNTKRFGDLGVRKND